MAKMSKAFLAYMKEADFADFPGSGIWGKEKKPMALIRKYWDGRRMVTLSSKKECKIYDAGVAAGQQERIVNFGAALEQRKADLDQRQKALKDSSNEAKVGALKAAAQAVDSIARMIAEIV